MSYYLELTCEIKLFFIIKSNEHNFFQVSCKRTIKDPVSAGVDFTKLCLASSQLWAKNLPFNFTNNFHKICNIIKLDLWAKICAPVAKPVRCSPKLCLVCQTPFAIKSFSSCLRQKGQAKMLVKSTPGWFK